MLPYYTGDHRTAMESEAYRFADVIIEALQALGFEATVGQGEVDVVIKVTESQRRHDVARIFIDPDWPSRAKIQARRAEPRTIAAIASTVDMLASRR